MLVYKSASERQVAIAKDAFQPKGDNKKIALSLQKRFCDEEVSISKDVFQPISDNNKSVLVCKSVSAIFAGNSR